MRALFHASPLFEEKQIVFILIYHKPYSIYHIPYMIYIYVYSNFYFGSTAAFPIKAYRFIFFIVAYMIRQNFNKNTF